MTRSSATVAVYRSQRVWRFDFIAQAFLLDLSLGLQPKFFSGTLRASSLFPKAVGALLYFEIVVV
jgi:hypothetical protein